MIRYELLSYCNDSIYSPRLPLGVRNLNDGAVTSAFDDEYSMVYTFQHAISPSLALTVITLGTSLAFWE